MDNLILTKIRRRMDMEKDALKEFRAYDDMDAVRWQSPKWLKEWERKQVSTAPHDALKTAYNIFDTNHPKWEILARGPQDTDRAEELERWLEWNMLRANTHGDEEPFRDILHHSSKYNRIVAQMEYLPYWLPKDKNKWTKEQKVAMQNGPYCVVVHHPGTVFYEFGKYVLRWAAKVVNVPVSDVIDYWNTYANKDGDEKGQKIYAAIQKLIDMQKESDEEVRVILVDYTDYDKRYVACWEAQKETLSQSDLDIEDDVIEILDGENKLSFIPWVIVKGNSTALLYSIYKGNHWENQNLIQTLLVSNTLRRGYFPLFKHMKGATGEPLDIDYESAEPTIELEPGEDAEQLQPPQIDSGFRDLAVLNQNEMAMSTGIRNLQNVETKGNIEFATLNAFIQLAMTQLEPYTRNAEKALASLGRMAFMWVMESGDTVEGYRMVSKGGSKVAGQQIDVGPEDFDPEHLHVSCELIANTPTDKMQLANMFATLINAGAKIPWSEVVERMALGFPEKLKEQWTQEQVENIALQDFGQKVQGQTAMQLQQMQGAMQMSMQQAAQANAPQGSPMQGQGQGFNPAQGGSTGNEAAPNVLNRTAQGGG